jgi:DnaK suppressor protein
MKAKQLLEFQLLFEKEKNNLTYSHSLINEGFNIVSEDLLDFNDLSCSELETSMRMRLQSREVLHLEKIDKALSRISEGTFGECAECGNEIGIGRLLARPTTTFCIQCKEEKEHMEQRQVVGASPLNRFTRQ